MASPVLDSVVREAYGRVLAGLLARGFPLHLAEDAVAIALSTAAETWGHNPPAEPIAWLHTVARHRALDLRRKEAPLWPMELAETMAHEDMGNLRNLDSTLDLADERLRLFYLCSHPAIDPTVQTPLMLQLVMGLSAEELAPLFLVEPAALGQRLVRAKQKIRLAAIRPELPDVAELPARTAAVRNAIYGLYLRGWEKPLAETQTEFAHLAESLSQTVASLVACDPESDGLAAFILLSEARRSARRSPDGRFVPLLQQSASDWDHARIQRGHEYLHRARQARAPGRYQLEAAIESAWMSRVVSGRPSGSELLALYDGLLQVAPSYGAHLGRILVLAEAHSPANALSELDALPEAKRYAPYWVLRAHLLRQIGAQRDAEAALARAQSFTADPAVRDFLAGEPSLT